MDEVGAIQAIKTKPFSARSFIEKKLLLEGGRPTPNIRLMHNGRNFQTKWFEDVDWLCGSPNGKLYCWPCLLFQPKMGQSWTDKGYTNYRNLLSDCKYHGTSMSHLSCYKKMKKFGKQDIGLLLSESGQVCKSRHNKVVEANTEYLKKSRTPFFILPSKKCFFGALMSPK